MATIRSALKHPGRMLLVLVLLLAASSPALAAFFRQAVGGISIAPNGVLSNSERDTNGLRQFRLDNMRPIADDLNQPNKLRKLSLRGLAEVLAELADKPQVPDEVMFLAGLQRIEYVLVYPEQNDIVLAGFGEGWEVDDRGNVVGVTTKRPVMQLDDLLIALRTADAARNGGITCSIDPTDEGLARVRKKANQLAQPGANPKRVASEMERELGPQVISFRGVPADGRFAHVLLGADFRMKRLGMAFDPSPLKRKLPSYLDMIKRHASAGMQNMLPRWWLTTNYEPLLTDGDGLAWQLRGQGVKCESEDDFLQADGSREHTGKANPAAKRWAELMTKHYDELSLKEPIFGELRNCIDLAVVAALISKENLAGKAGLDMGALLNPDVYATEKFNIPKHVDTKASYVETAKGYLLSASGGVELNTWEVADHKETSDELAPIRATVADSRDKRWWWN